MEQILLHMVGDYITQNHWMATNKVKNTIIGYIACFIHCLLYSIPFLLITNINAVFIIFITHFFIDKYRIATCVIQLKNWCFTENGFPKEVPAFISVWLLFIVDNIIHVLINYFCIKFL